MKLTAKSIAALPLPETGQREIADDAARGLLLVLSAGGARSWQFRIQNRGRRIRRTLGPFPAVSLADARAEAARLLREISLGRDPDHDAGMTCAKVWEQLFWPNRSADLKRPGLDESIWRRLVAPVIGDLPIRSVGPLHYDEMLALWRKEGLDAGMRGPFRVASVFFRWAEDRRIIERSPMPRQAPVPRRSREVVPTVEDVGALYRRALAGGGSSWAAVALLCLVPLRRDEARCLAWSEVDRDDRALVIPAARMKAGREHWCPLPDAALDLISGARMSRFVFPGRLDQPVTLALSELPRKAGFEFTIHDLRRGFATRMVDAEGFDPSVVRLCLAHSPGQVFGAVGAVYVKAQMREERRRCAERWAELVTGAAR